MIFCSVVMPDTPLAPWGVACEVAAACESAQLLCLFCTLAAYQV